MAIAIILLLNFTAPNPTGRRYSSESPLTSGQGNSREIGLNGERILARDLGVPRNDLPDQRQCFCQDRYRSVPLPSECRVCMVYAVLESSSHRRPDFVAPSFIAEVKNTQSLLYEQSDTLSQIGDYVISARAANRPLYLYTRVNTRLDPEFYQLVESTGGAVVHYFTVPGWVDPVDEAARLALGIGAGMFVLGFIMPSRLPRFQRQQRQAKPRRADDPVSRTARKIDAMDDFVTRTKDNKRFEIDVEDSRND
ncbi:MAG: hypothetical protein NZ750_06760 [Anaerolineae bacterium]|nr:hypothetical protein [Anaerolineae bacterium]MDW8172002.1 hypothetical protein [Anaerolineae bacterium]